MISASVAPLGRPISSRIFSLLLSARGVLASFARAGFGGPFASLGLLLRRSLGPTAVGGFPALGPAPLLADAFLRGDPLTRNGRALFGDGGGCVGFCVGHVGSGPFLRFVCA